MGKEKKFDAERDELSPEEMQAMEILQDVYDHKISPFEGLKKMIKLVEENEYQDPDAAEASKQGDKLFENQDTDTQPV